MEPPRHERQTSGSVIGDLIANPDVRIAQFLLTQRAKAHLEPELLTKDIEPIVSMHQDHAQIIGPAEPVPPEAAE